QHHVGKKVILGFFLGALSVFTVCGNILVLHAIRTEKRLRTVSNLFILSLAIADLAVGLLVMPLSSVTIVAGRWPFKHNVICLIWLSTDYVASTASIFNLFILSLDRYWAVVHPLRYLRNRTRKRATTFILLIWLIASLWIPAIILWPYLVPSSEPLTENVCDTAFRGNKTFKTFTALINFYIPLLGMIILSCRIMQAIRLRSKMEIGRRLSAATQKQMQNARSISRANKKAEQLHLQKQQRISDDPPKKRFSALYLPTGYNSSKAESNKSTSLKILSSSKNPYDHDQYSSSNDICTLNSSSPTGNSTYVKKNCSCSKNNNNIFFPYDHEDQESFSMQYIETDNTEGSKAYERYFISLENNDKLRMPTSNSFNNPLSKFHKRFSFLSLPPILFSTKRKSCQPVIHTDMYDTHCETKPSMGVQQNMKYIDNVTNKLLEKSCTSSVTSSFSDEYLETLTANLPIVLKKSPTLPLLSSNVTKSHSIDNDYLPSPNSLSKNNRAPSVNDLTKLAGNLTQSETPLSKNVKSWSKLPVPNDIDHVNSLPHISMGCCKFLIFLKDPSRAHALQKELKAARQLGMLVGVFTVNWLPYFILFMVVAWCKTCVSDSIFLSSIWLGYLNSSLNPLIYPLCNTHFRRAFKKIFYCVDVETKRKLPTLSKLKELQSLSARHGPRTLSTNT
ncbi:unnamed protein product, partial [Didymodactylos carnosus]